MGVAADDIDQAAAGFQREGGRGGSGLNQLQGLFELVGVLLQALLVKRVAFEQVVFQSGGGPAAELGGIFGFHAVTNGKHCIQIVVFDLPRYLTFAFDSNYRVILGSYFFFQLGFGIDVSQVQTDIVGAGVKQVCHLRLRQPYGVGVEADFNLGLSVCALVDFDWVIHACNVFMIGGRLPEKRSGGFR